MNDFVLPELKQIIGAMLFVRKEPLTVEEIRRVLTATAERRGGITSDFAKANEALIREAVDELSRDLVERKAGFHVTEVAGGWRLENDANCGPWLRTLLQKGRGTRLSLPALETLAIIAYRQPCVRSEIEAVRGVAVDQILRNLMEMQLVRVIGRSELPGRPWMYGTTQKFMEHFGLKSLDDLPGTDELRRMEAEQQALRATKAAEAAADEAEEPTEVEAAEDAEGEGEEGSFEREGMTEEEIVGADDSEGEEDEFADEEEDEFDDEDDDEFDEDDEDDEEDEE
ncbi:MAG TPA: SMC-Scp complex subunit ScpB [Kiritimatiellia bacterium]|jgi:segregation and condensation protein B|nr:SMC-Scp complex subunit ScpB [Kiritimatiellia bacterium]